jgi:hypothetical protein
MAKKNEVPVNGENGNGQVVTVVQQKAMGMQEKARIEKLIDQRAENLKNYLTELKNFAMEANDHVEDEFTGDRKDLQRKILELQTEINELDAESEREITVVGHVLDDEMRVKIRELENQIQLVKNEFRDQKTAATQEINNKYKDRQEKMGTRMEELNTELENLRKKENKNKMFRKVALANSFSTLRDNINDSRCRAVEGLYTEAVTPDQARTHLNLLPDTMVFRQQVTPEKLFMIFDSNIQVKMLENKELKCGYCGKENNFATMDDGSYYCRSCGRYRTLDKDIKEMVSLPSLNEIMNAAQEEKPASDPAPKISEVTETV